MDRDHLLNMDAATYKEYVKLHMQNNHGSSALHTFLCIFFTVQCSLYCGLSNRHSKNILQWASEYVFIVLPLILAHTIFAGYIYFLNCVIFTMLLQKIIYHYPILQIKETFSSKNYFHTTKVNSITCLRGLTHLITGFAILAVDFEIFPKNLAKTATYGYSLMDTGVGLFVLMSGLVHKDLRHKRFSTALRSNTKIIFMLVVCGLGRYISIKKSGYHENVTEYGVHWNFFFTLAVCKFLSTILLYYCSRALTASITVLMIHECILYVGLEEWVFSAIPRTNLLDANREGLSSNLGFVSLYLFAAYMKSLICDKTVIRYKVQLRLISYSVILCTLAFITNIYRPTSRTIANAGYCLYLAAVLVIVMTIMYCIEVQFQNKDIQYEVPIIVSEINSNGLVYFTVANVLTGAVNLSIRTLAVPALEAFLILNIYMILTLSLVICFKKIGFVA